VPTAGVVADDHIAPTQPFATGLPSLTPPDLKESDMWGATMFDQMICRIQFRQSAYEGQFTPPHLGKETIVYPAFYGIVDWQGASIDPVHKLLVANASYLPFRIRLEKRGAVEATGVLPKWDGKGNKPAAKGDALSISPDYGTPYVAYTNPWLGPLDVPCKGPIWGTLTAIDLVSKKIVWQHPIGTTRDTGPFRSHVNLPLKTGMFNIGGNMITKSGLVFIGATADDYLRHPPVRRQGSLARAPAGRRPGHADELRDRRQAVRRDRRRRPRRPGHALGRLHPGLRAAGLTGTHGKQAKGAAGNGCALCVFGDPRRCPGWPRRCSDAADPCAGEPSSAAAFECGDKAPRRASKPPLDMNTTASSGFTMRASSAMKRIHRRHRMAFAAQRVHHLVGVPRQFGRCRNTTTSARSSDGASASACAPSRIELLRGSIATTMRRRADLRPQPAQRGGDGGGVVGKVVVHVDAGMPADQLQPPLDAVEPRQRRQHVGRLDAHRMRGGQCGQPVHHVVPAQQRPVHGAQFNAPVQHCERTAVGLQQTRAPVETGAAVAARDGHRPHPGRRFPPASSSPSPASARRASSPLTISRPLPGTVRTR
jgi:hypothetical protein